MSRYLRPSLSWLLIFVPITLFLSFVVKPSPAIIFISSCLAIVPLAGLMGQATEVLAEKAGAGVGGLLNATFGNAAELIIAYVALSKGLHDVVKASLTGSIIGNILLVLGFAALAGGARHETLRFNITAASSGASMLLLSAIGLMVPAMFAGLTQNHDAVRLLSEEVSVVMLLTYLASLWFSLKTHKHLYVGGPAEEQAETHAEQGSLPRAVLKLLTATILVAWMSEILVGVVEQASHQMGLSDTFVGVVVVAIIGNAAEHSTAIMMAMKNKMDVAIAIAIGSSTQIALFVAPVLMLSSLFMEKPMDLVFTAPEVASVVISVLVVGQIAQDGETHWLEGIQLLSVYAIICFLFYHLH